MSTSLHSHHGRVGQKIWDGKYFGQDGAVALALEAYHSSLWKCDKEIHVTTLMLASTLYSALIHCLVQVKYFRMEYVWLSVKTLRQLNLTLQKILKEEMSQSFNSSNKEVLIAILLVCRFIYPFSGYRSVAIKLGESIVSEKDVSLLTRAFVTARLSRLWFYSKRKECKLYVARLMDSLWKPFYASELPSWAIVTDKNKDAFKSVDWKTVNRLARLIGDKEMVTFSARHSNSQDVVIKSGM